MKSERPLDLDRALRAIQNQLYRLIEARAVPSATDLTESKPPLVLPEPSPPQHSSVPPLPAVTAARASRNSIFVVVGTTQTAEATSPRFLTHLGRALVEHGESTCFVRWHGDTRKFQLLTRDELDRLELLVHPGERSVHYPVAGEAPVVVDVPSCGTNDWLLVPESIRAATDRLHLIEMDMVLEAKRLAMRSAFIFHGADPLRLTNRAGGGAEGHEQYMQALLLADAVTPISTLALNDLISFFAQHQRAEWVPLVKKIVPPVETEGKTADQWRDYGRRLRGLLKDALEASRHVQSFYYLIDPTASAADSRTLLAHRLARALTECGTALVPAVWDAEAGRLSPPRRGQLDLWEGVQSRTWARWTEPGGTEAPGWILDAWGAAGEQVRQLASFAGHWRLRTAVVLHEARDSAQDRVLLEALVGIDKVFAVSQRRFSDFERFLLSWQGKVHSAEHRFKALPSPSEVPDQSRRALPKASAPGVVRALVVLPGERAANPAIVIAAAAEAAKLSVKQLVFAFADTSRCLTPAQQEMTKTKVASIPQARWEYEIDRRRFEQLIEEADFAVLTSLDGDAAYPATECLWRAVPCLVHSRANEAASPGGGFDFTNMLDEERLTEAILKLTEEDWRRCLAHEAVGRSICTWEEYARQMAFEVATDRLTDSLRRVQTPMRSDVYATLVNLRRRPKLSLCISTYNRAGWVQVNLRNIFTQIAKPSDDLEVLVVDNTSLDHTEEVVKPYLDRPDFRYVRNPKNVGMLGNLAVTAQRAKGQYVWIIGDDDLTRPGAIDRVLQIIERHPTLGLIYLNYGYTTEADPGNVTDLPAFLASYNMLEPAGPDELATVKRLSTKCENFFGAIYSHVYRRDHALRSYCQNTSGRIFSTMLTCVPTSYYVLNYMADEPAYWVGEPSLVVNSNVSWQDYGALLELEQLPRTWDLAERMGADPEEVDRRRANRLWLVEMMWRDIFENDKAGNSAYFSAPRVLMRLKHLTEIDKHIPEFRSIYDRAHKAGHPAAFMPSEELFSAFTNSRG